MTLENAKVLHKHFLEIGRNGAAANLEIRYPELKQPEPKPEPEPKPVVKKDGKKSKR